MIKASDNEVPRSADDALEKLKLASQNITKDPYNAVNYLDRSLVYRDLRYPDLASGDAYKALLLLDEISDESGEYHDEVEVAFQTTNYSLEGLRRSVYQVLVQSLSDCGCFKSAHTYAKQWEKMSSEPVPIPPSSSDVLETYRKVSGVTDTDHIDSNDLPDITLVRRELYPWNDQNPDRNSEEFVALLNEQLEDINAKCRVQVAEYPILTGETGTMKQLGLFANEDIQPGEVVLHERSLLTANNNLYDALCDACSAELPQLGESTNAFSCEDCEDTVFCSQICLDAAMESYHPAVCDKSIESIARDTKPNEASDALYFLLLARSFAMAETQDIHPLQLRETSSLWGDFTTIPSDNSPTKPSLPFSFTYNVLYPIHLLTQMDIDIYATTPKYDFWIINTLYAKFRGVASGRPNRQTGKPEVCAVHPLWCLANHSCAPNVTWEWSGDIELVARKGDQIVRWGEEQREAAAAATAAGEQNKESNTGKWNGGIKKGQEIWNHYCDVELDVKQRREWARGPLGGDCMCERCVWEEQQQTSLPHLNDLNIGE